MGSYSQQLQQDVYMIIFCNGNMVYMRIVQQHSTISSNKNAYKFRRPYTVQLVIGESFTAQQQYTETRNKTIF